MTFEIALRKRLITDAAVKATTGKTVTGTPTMEWGERPQLSSYPAGVLSIVSDPRGRTMTGLQGSIPIHLQVDVLARTAEQKVALREAVLAVLVRGAVIDGIRFGPSRDVTVTDASEADDTGFVHRDIIDLIIWHKKEA